MNFKPLIFNTSSRSEATSILRLAWPVMGAQCLMLSMVFVDNVMVGHLGPEPLGAMAMASVVYGIFFVTSIGLMSALSPLISQAFGAKDFDKVGFYFRQGLYVAGFCAAAAILLITQSDHLLALLGQKAKLIPIARTFLRAIAWGTPAQMAYVCIRQYTEGTSDTPPSIITVGIGTIINALLDYGLIFGNWGFPKLGVAGSGYATASVQWAMALAMFGYVSVSPKYLRYRFWKGSFAFDWTAIKEIFGLGLPLAGGMISEVAFFGGSTLVMGTIGTRELAAHQIAMNAASFTFMIPLGLAIAAAIRIGQLTGMKNLEQVRVAGQVSLRLTVLLQLISASCFILMPTLISRMYTSSVDIIALSTRFLVVAGIFQIFDGLQVMGINLLKGISDTRRPFINSFVSYWVVGAPSALALTFPLKIGPTGLWYGMLVGLASASLLHWLRFRALTETVALTQSPSRDFAV